MTANAARMRRRRQRATCQRKEPFTEDKARALVAFYRWKEGDLTIEPYCCPICNSWHIGHPSRPIVAVGA